MTMMPDIDLSIFERAQALLQKPLSPTVAERELLEGQQKNQSGTTGSGTTSSPTVRKIVSSTGVTGGRKQASGAGAAASRSNTSSPSKAASAATGGSKKPLKTNAGGNKASSSTRPPGPGTSKPAAPVARSRAPTGDSDSVFDTGGAGQNSFDGDSSNTGFASQNDNYFNDSYDEDDSNLHVPNALSIREVAQTLDTFTNELKQKANPLKKGDHYLPANLQHKVGKVDEPFSEEAHKEKLEKIKELEKELKREKRNKKRPGQLLVAGGGGATSNGAATKAPSSSAGGSSKTSKSRVNYPTGGGADEDGLHGEEDDNPDDDSLFTEPLRARDRSGSTASSSTVATGVGGGASGSRKQDTTLASKQASNKPPFRTGMTASSMPAHHNSNGAAIADQQQPLIEIEDEKVVRLQEMTRKRVLDIDRQKREQKQQEEEKLELDRLRKESLNDPDRIVLTTQQESKQRVLERKKREKQEQLEKERKEKLEEQLQKEKFEEKARILQEKTRERVLEQKLKQKQEKEQKLIEMEQKREQDELMGNLKSELLSEAQRLAIERSREILETKQKQEWEEKMRRDREEQERIERLKRARKQYSHLTTGGGGNQKAGSSQLRGGVYAAGGQEDADADAYEPLSTPGVSVSVSGTTSSTTAGNGVSAASTGSSAAPAARRDRYANARATAPRMRDNVNNQHKQQNARPSAPARVLNNNKARSPTENLPVDVTKVVVNTNISGRNQEEDQLFFQQSDDFEIIGAVNPFLDEEDLQKMRTSSDVVQAVPPVAPAPASKNLQPVKQIQPKSFSSINTSNSYSNRPTPRSKLLQAGTNIHSTVSSRPSSGRSGAGGAPQQHNKDKRAIQQAARAIVAGAGGGGQEPSNKISNKNLIQGTNLRNISSHEKAVLPVPLRAGGTSNLHSQNNSRIHSARSNASSSRAVNNHQNYQKKPPPLPCELGELLQYEEQEEYGVDHAVSARGRERQKAKQVQHAVQHVDNNFSDDDDESTSGIEPVVNQNGNFILPDIREPEEIPEYLREDKDETCPFPKSLKAYQEFEKQKQMRKEMGLPSREPNRVFTGAIKQNGGGGGVQHLLGGGGNVVKGMNNNLNTSAGVMAGDGPPLDDSVTKKRGRAAASREPRPKPHFAVDVVDKSAVLASAAGVAISAQQDHVSPRTTNTSTTAPGAGGTAKKPPAWRKQKPIEMPSADEILKNMKRARSVTRSRGGGGNVVVG
ncbi:unnamed protein product [Amoebophrya sp. A120]|nr:unnamed protein product [Amoebophrya sp. A120]|eukprot:GSA120T00015847001.1